MPSFSLDLWAGYIYSLLKCPCFTPCHPVFVESMSEECQSPRLHLVAGSISTFLNLGISGIRRRAGCVRTENNLKPVLLHVWVAWASVLSPWHHPSPIPSPSFSARIHVPCSHLWLPTELEWVTYMYMHHSHLCVFNIRGREILRKGLLALCCMINKCLWTSVPLILGGRFQGCL